MLKYVVGKTLRETIKFAALLAAAHDKDVRQHFDSFGKRIFTTLVYAPSVHSLRWTVLSQLDLHELGLATKWLLLSILCGIDVFHPNFYHILFNGNANVSSASSLRTYVEEACRSGELERMFAQLEEQQQLSDVELLSYLKTLHFLVDLNNARHHHQRRRHSHNHNHNHNHSTIDTDAATATAKGDQDDAEDEFMGCVLKVIFSVSFCLERTRETCYKEGNALLFAICSAHPQLLGRVLHEIDAHLAVVGKRALYLCDQLPFDRWLAHMDGESADVRLVHKLVLANATNSIMFRLAVDALDKMHMHEEEHHESGGGGGHEGGERIRLVKFKLCVMLFELHARLTIPGYFLATCSSSNNEANATAPSTSPYPQLFSYPDSSSKTTNGSGSSTSCNGGAVAAGKGNSQVDLLATHYSRLTKVCFFSKTYN